jgi:hypothetical protein
VRRPLVRRLAAATLALLSVLAVAACQRDTQRRIALRILDRYRRVTAAKPLPASHVVRMRLSSESAGGAAGAGEIHWEPNRYRERTSSAGAATEWGLQAGKAYYTDEDGVTRVVSEPVVRELLTRSYFWRRGWLFADTERARTALGPAQGGKVSVRLTPKGGNELLLEFSREGRLVSARSPGFRFDFSGASSFRESGGRRPPVRVEIVGIGLPTGRIPDTAAGGGRARFAASAAPLPFERTPSGGISFAARVNGADLRLSLDSAADGPLGLSPEAARRAGVKLSRDVYGRAIAGGALLEVGGLSSPGIHVVEVPRPPMESDGIVGATVFREAVVEIDGAGDRLAFHDPERWVAPPGFTRVLVDDDGNRPVAMLRRQGDFARFLLGTATGTADLLLADSVAARLGLELPGRVGGWRWGPLALPEAGVAREARPVLPDWGEDGSFGHGLLLRFHAHVDMPHRWVYLRLASGR